MNNYLTSYTGFQATENYQSFFIGSAFATPIGAISFDATQHLDSTPQLLHV
nr:fimbria/pilus outer membrane usher protein [Acinetobacter baumannii]